MGINFLIYRLTNATLLDNFIKKINKDISCLPHLTCEHQRNIHIQGVDIRKSITRKNGKIR